MSITEDEIPTCVVNAADLQLLLALTGLPTNANLTHASDLISNLCTEAGSIPTEIWSAHPTGEELKYKTTIADLYALQVHLETGHQLSPEPKPASNDLSPSAKAILVYLSHLVKQKMFHVNARHMDQAATRFSAYVKLYSNTLLSRVYQLAIEKIVPGNPNASRSCIFQYIFGTRDVDPRSVQLEMVVALIGDPSDGLDTVCRKLVEYRNTNPTSVLFTQTTSNESGLRKLTRL